MEPWPVVSFNIEGFAPSEVAHQLDRRFETMVRGGLHCAPEAHRTLGTFPTGTVRLSAGLMNTTEEIEQTLSAIRQLAAGGNR